MPQRYPFFKKEETIPDHQSIQDYAKTVKPYVLKVVHDMISIMIL